MTAQVLMPVITTAGEPAVVTAWFVDEGKPCESGQLIAEVQAEKVAEEVVADQAGFVVDRVDLGDPVEQGQPICRVVDTIDAPDRQRPAMASASVSSGVRASPSAKRVARDLGVDLISVSGTGPDGRITEVDVRNAAGGVAMIGLRAVVARNMRHSHTETAPVTLFTTVNLGLSVPDHPTATIVKAVAEALEGHPQLNGTREGDIFQPATTAHISLAIQTDDGLVAPVLRDPAGKSSDAIAAEVADLAGRARAKALSATDFEGGTFTVSNLGSYGIEGFTPIINLPQMAILGVGAVKRVARIDDDASIGIGHEMALSLTFDHAFVDGAPAAEFLADLRRRLEG